MDLLSDDLLYATESKSRTGALELHRKIRLADGATSFEDQADKGDGILAVIISGLQVEAVRRLARHVGRL